METQTKSRVAISATARRLLDLLTSLCRASGATKSTQEWLGEKIRVSRGTCSNAVAELKRHGLLEVRRTIKDGAIYRVLGKISDLKTTPESHVDMNMEFHAGMEMEFHAGMESECHAGVNMEFNAGMESNKDTSITSSSSAAAAFASLQKIEIQQTPAIVEAVLRNPADAEIVLTWLAVRFADRENPIRKPQAFATAALRDPSKFAFRRDGAGKLTAPAKESQTIDRAELARQRSARIDADMERRRREDAQAARQREADANYQTNLAEWWLGLSEAHKAIVHAKAGGSTSLTLKDQTYKFWLAAKCFRGGLLPGAVPPPQKPKAGEP